MFQRLRNNFLLLNMIIISVLLLGAFSMVYLFTLNQIQRNIDIRLSRTLEPDKDFHRDADRISDRTDAMEDNAPPDTPSGAPPQDTENIPENRPGPLALDFTIETDSEGNIEKIDSIFDIDQQVYADIAAAVFETKKDNGDLKVEDVYWAYRRQSLNSGRFRIGVLDISQEKKMLQNLIFTFTGVGLLALIVIFLISRFFANRAIRPISAAWEKQNQFIADASHELKTPLTTINTNIDVLLSRPDSTIQEEHKWLGYIKTEAERMTRLTNDLLYLARLDNDEHKLPRISFSLSEAVQSILLTMEAVIFEKQCTLTEEIQEHLHIMGNPDQIKQLTMILLDNAIKYTGKGGQITVLLHQIDKRILLSISNTGTPIAPEIQKKIFDRFYRADPSRARNSGGYGLGLAIAQAICQQNNAHINVSCQNGINTFSVSFNRYTS